MKPSINLAVYLAVIGTLAILVFFVLNAGKRLELPAGAVYKPDPASAVPDQANGIVIFLEQAIVVLMTSVVCGAIFGKIGQPKVIGQIIGGILLGPSFLGRFFPGITQSLFPVSSLGNLRTVAQLGLILFMFITGMEVNTGLVGKKMPTAVVISHISIALPFALGAAVSYFLYREFAPPNIAFYAFSLFIGIAMSITAFPVLASIVRDRGWSGTAIGSMAISCAATDDITAWCLLAIVLSILGGSSIAASLSILLLIVVYAAGMLLAIRPVMARLLEAAGGKRQSNTAIVTMTFALLLLSAYFSERIGIHVLFGAFMAGICMPAKKDFRLQIIAKIEDISLILLLPIFYVFTGLRTRVDLLGTGSLWMTCALVCAVAIAGKFGGSAIAARFMGESVKDSLALGALMNTRGLVELVVLNIGYDMGILKPELFTMMVIMAVVTSFMTSPVLLLIERIKS